jgi:hypothetical protein
MLSEEIVWRSALTSNRLDPFGYLNFWIEYWILSFMIISLSFALLISIKIACGTKLAVLESFSFVHMLLG